MSVLPFSFCVDFVAEILSLLKEKLEVATPVSNKTVK